jgi:hypothetical protein
MDVKPKEAALGSHWVCIGFALSAHRNGDGRHSQRWLTGGYDE